MDAFTFYTAGTSAWLSVQAVPLLLFPRLLLPILTQTVREPTSLEIYLSRSLAFTLLALGAISLIVSSAPLSTLPETGTEEDKPNAADKAPYAFPTLLITLTYHASSAFYLYSSYLRYKQSGFVLGLVGSTLLGAIGAWCVLFGRDVGRTRKDGKDRRMSGWPFKNVEAKQRGKKKI